MLNITKFEQEQFDYGFNQGAHQAMQETRLEIALNLIRQVCQEEPPKYGLNSVAEDLAKGLFAFRQSSR